MKYQLIVITNRSLEAPRYFETYEEAYHVMESELSEAMDVDPAHFCEHEDYEDSFCIDDYSAWISDHGFNNVDWYIIPLEEKES